MLYVYDPWSWFMPVPGPQVPVTLNGKCLAGLARGAAVAATIAPGKVTVQAADSPPETFTAVAGRTYYLRIEFVKGWWENHAKLSVPDDDATGRDEVRRCKLVAAGSKCSAVHD
ncbi:MAG TPA: hypothetical protein VNW92_04635 [Polyangiaceae bacterium]|nr:hypothetical protein [Polyangiaceae bacterium]